MTPSPVSSLRLSGFKAWTRSIWMHDDSADNFDRHCGNKRTLRLLEKNGYTYETEIEYQIDQYGLRNNPDVNISDAILTLGCSFTFGTGLDVKHIWPTMLGDLMDKPVYNGGLPGSSNDAAFRIAEYLIPKYKPQAVVLLSPFDVRYEFYARWTPFEYSTSHYPIWVDEIGDGSVQRIELGTDLHNRLNAKKNILAIQCLCYEHNIPFVWDTVDHARAGAIKNDLARDLKHFGKGTHKLIADNFSNRLTLNNNTV